MRRFSVALLLALLALAARAAGGVADEQAFFASTLVGLDGKPAPLAAYRGRPLVVNFWARWCGPCRDELPLLAKRVAQARDGDPAVLGVALEDKGEAVRDFARAYDIGYPLLLAQDKGISLLRALGNTAGGLPFTVAFDRHGRLVFSQVGRLQAVDLERAILAARQP